MSVIVADMDTTTKPATLAAVPVALYLFGLAPNAAYRAVNTGMLADGLPAFRAGAQRWLVATAAVERVIGRTLTDDDIAALVRLGDELSNVRRDRRNDATHADQTTND